MFICLAYSNVNKSLGYAAIIWARSLAGKAPRSQRGDRGFESLRVHHVGAKFVLFRLIFCKNRSYIRFLAPPFPVLLLLAYSRARYAPACCQLFSGCGSSVPTSKCRKSFFHSPLTNGHCTNTYYFKGGFAVKVML